MLKEIVNKKINSDRNSFRRWFENDTLELIVWYSDEKLLDISGFELCYGKKHNEHAIRFSKEGFISHTNIDSGSENPLKNMTPIHVPDGEIDKNFLVKVFSDNAEGLEPEIHNFVLSKLSIL